MPITDSSPLAVYRADRPASAAAAPDAARPGATRALRITLVALGLGVAWACLPFLPGLMGAAMLCVVVAPAHRALAPRLGARRSALVLSVGVALLLAVPAIALLVALIQQAPAALQRMMDSAAFARLSRFAIGPLDVGAQLADAGRNLVAWGSSRALSAAAGLTRVVLNLFLAALGLYYLLPSAPALWLRVRGRIPVSPAGADHLAERFVSVTEAALLGIAATAIAQGLTVGLAFWLVGLSNPVVWGGVTGAVSILPVFGSSLVWLPGAAVLAAEGRIGAALTLFLIGIVISSNVDNVIRPLIYRRVSGLHPMASLVGAFAGVELFGLVGLLLGPLALAYCVELYHLYELESGSPAGIDQPAPLV